MNITRPQAPGLHAGTAAHAAPSAALLIDFDNVTMNVRSDLGKELKTLLDSDLIRGRVAVRRAYADWRRYPASVVPLTEASVDLIFAPAYGTSKKNATDLRMAVDAIELAFMRPEIGTFILLTGDSDFSSCVIKLKEYGKYVIGVGMRESSSDLLIQNCDEYYSYHGLTGLTRAGDDTGQREDPWELVTRAVQRMVKNGDTMRVDRLKQVMLEMDAGFDEKQIGYSKFSRFISEAQQRGLLRLRRSDDGQWEVVADASAEAAAAGAEPRSDRERDRDRGRRNGRTRDRGGRGRDRGPRPEPRPIAAEAPAPAPAEEPARAEVAAAEAAPAAPPARETPREAPRAPAAPAAAVDPLRNAYSLLQHTLRDMTSRRGQTVRDGDLKRKMMDAGSGFDEGELGFSKFSRFLRQAHEDDIVEIQRNDDGTYEVSLPSGGVRLPAPVAAGTPARAAGETAAAGAEAAPAGPGSDDPAALHPRSRRGRGRGIAAGPPPLLPGQVAGTVGAVGAVTPEPAAAAPAAREEEAPAEAAREEVEAAKQVHHREPAVASARLDDPAAIANRGSSTARGAVGVRGRRGRGRGGEPGAPPPILPGQTVGAAATPAARREEPAAAPAAEAAFDPQALGLPADRAGIEAHVASYRGVGKRSAEALTEAFGEDVFRALEEDPDAVRSLLGRRAAPLLEQWAEDRAARAAAAPAAEPEPQPEPEQAPAAEAAPAEETPAPRARGRGRRGGRGRGGAPAAGAPSAEVAAAAESAPEAPAPEVVAAEAAAPETAAVEAPEAGKAPARTRGRRGRGGRGKGAAAEAAAETPAVGAPAAEAPAAEAASEAEKPARGRGRRGRGKAAPAEPAVEAPAAEPAPEAMQAPARGRRGRGKAAAAEPAESPASTPAPEARAPARGRRGRGKAAAGEASAEAPAAAPAAEPEKAAARGRRGRGKAAAGTAAAPAQPPAPAPEPKAEGAAPRRRGGRGRGGKGRTGGNAE